jgi:hypothetical protein
MELVQQIAGLQQELIVALGGNGPRPQQPRRRESLRDVSIFSVLDILGQARIILILFSVTRICSRHMCDILCGWIGYVSISNSM